MENGYSAVHSTVNIASQLQDKEVYIFLFVFSLPHPMHI